MASVASIAPFPTRTILSTGTPHPHSAPRMSQSCVSVPVRQVQFNVLRLAVPTHRTVVRPPATRVVKPLAAISEEAPPSQEFGDTEGGSQEQKPRHVLRAEARSRQQSQYQSAAIATTLGIGGTAILATFYRFSWHTPDGAGVPYVELFASLAFTVGAAVGMEMYARYAHKHLWHESWMWALPKDWRAEWNKPFWKLHQSHHEPREGAFEQNDIFAVANAVPAIALILYGFLHGGVVPGMCFGAGLGITIFGMAYMFVHDGLVHKRFPVGPIAEVPYLKKIAMGHKLHHSEKFGGAPWGLFFGLQELERLEGGLEEIDSMLLAAELRERAAKDMEGVI